MRQRSLWEDEQIFADTSLADEQTAIFEAQDFESGDDGQDALPAYRQRKQTWAYVLCGAGALLFALAGYWIGRLNAPYQQANPDTALVQVTQAPGTASENGEYAALEEGNVLQPEPTAFANESQVMENTEPETLPVEAQNAQTLEEAAGSYILKRLENGLSIFFDGVALAHLQMPEDLSSETLAQLESGMAFSSLEEIEGWLESFDN